MPTYEYGCDACGNEWEIEQRISEDPIKKCPKCGKKKAKRLISGASFILKGGGWYNDLYSKPKPVVSDDVKKLMENPPESKSKSDDAGGADAKADKAPDKKASEPKSEKAEKPEKKEKKPAKKAKSGK